MSDATLQALIAAVVTVALAYIGRKAQVAAQTAQTVARKVDVLDAKTDHVVTLTNSTLTAAKVALASARERIERLEKLAGVEPGAPLPKHPEAP